MLTALLSVAYAHAEEFADEPAPTAPETRLDRTLHAFTWPAYRYSFAAEDHSKLGRTEEFVLASERLGFLADATTTELGFSHGQEGDPMNSLFGTTNKVGVLGSMTAWDMGFMYSSVVVPHWFEHTRYQKTARIAAIAGGAVLTGFRVKMVMQNSQFIR